MVRDLMDDWMEFIQGNTEPIFADLRSRGYKSTLDLPVICFFDDLMIEFPKAKVLLTVRDSPQAWVKVRQLNRIQCDKIIFSHFEIPFGKCSYCRTIVQ